MDITRIQGAILKRYAEVSVSAEGRFNYPTGRRGAISLGYDLSVVDNISDEFIDSFCGVGNPFSLGQIRPGEVILDIGCGAGFDLIYASSIVGQGGKICGIDMTPEMVNKAKHNLKVYGASNYDVQVAGAESIPYEDNAFDVVISNGVLNLSPLKEKSFQEIFRVLKPGGRFQFADIVLNENAPQVCSTLEGWSN